MANLPPLKDIPAGMATWVRHVDQVIQRIDRSVQNNPVLIPAAAAASIVRVGQQAQDAANAAAGAQQAASVAGGTAGDAAALAQIPYSQIKTASIFPNADFDDEFNHWTTNGDVTWDGTVGRGDVANGGAILAHDGNVGTDTSIWADPVPTSLGRIYAYTLWVKPVTTAITAGRLTVLQQQLQIDGSATGDTIYTNDVTIPADVWTMLSFTGVAMDTDTVQVQIGIQLGGDAVLTMYLDSISVIQAITGDLIVQGALDAYKIRSPDIATSDDPDRIAFESDGIYQYVANAVKSYWIPSEFQLVDGEIIGSTITGSLIRTAATGPRVEISGPDPSDPQKKLNINMIGDDPLEINPGGVAFIPSDSITGPDPTIILRTPLMGDGGVGRYITELSLGSNRRFELDANFTDTSTPGNNRYTTLYGDPSFANITSGSVTVQGWNNIYLQYTELDPDTGIPMLDHNRITMNENGTFIAGTLYVASASGTETALKMYRDGSANLKLYNGNDRLVINASGGALLGAAGSKLFDWDTNYTYNYGAMYFRSSGGTQTDTSLSRNTLGLKLNNVMVAQGFRLTDTSDVDTGNRITVNTTAGTVGRMDFIAGTANGFGFVGAVAMGSASITNQLSIGDSNKYIKPQSDNANNLEIHSDSGAVKFIAASGADFAVTTPSGTPGLVSVTLYNRTTGSGAANVNVASNGVMARATSSRRWKDKIKDLTLPQAKSLLDLRPVTYQSKCADDDKRRRLVGLIAEEVDEAGVKELVSYEKPGVPDGVTYDRAVPHVILLIKDLYKEIDQLKSQLTAQRAGK